MIGEALTEREAPWLASHGLTLADANAAMLRRVDSITGAELMGRRDARNYAGVVFHHVRENRVTGHTLRRDQPDLEQGRNGERREARKYLHPPGQRGIYMPPGCDLARLDDPSADILLVEGLFQCLIAHKLKPADIVFGLMGCYGYRGVVGKDYNANGERVDVRGLLSELDAINWTARNVYLVFDSDVAVNPYVRHARRLLAVELVQRGAAVYFVEIPHPTEGKRGLDDWYVGCGEAEVLNGFERARLFALDPDAALEPIKELSADASLAELRAALSRVSDLLSKGDDLTRHIVRAEVVRLLKERGNAHPQKIVDAALNVPAEETKLTCDLFTETEPWPEPVNGATLLDELVAAQKRFLIASESVYALVALWSLFSHSFDCYDCLPVLYITAPSKQCGKSTLLTLLRVFARLAVLVSNMTPAVLFRIGETYRPTLLVDEVETILRDNEALRGLIDGGHTRSTALVLRCVGETNEVKAFSTYYPKVLCGLGSLPDTIADRSISIRLNRATSVEHHGLEYLTLKLQDELAHLRAKGVRWAADNPEALKVADPKIPDEITNARARDNLRPLFAVADIAGGRWPELAREVAIQLSGNDDSLSVKELLLTDLQTLFEERNAEALETHVILEYLHSLDTRPWPEWGRQKKPITGRGLGQLLKDFEVTSDKWREGSSTFRGYRRVALQDVFSRYCASIPTATSATESKISSLQGIPPATKGDSVAEVDHANLLKEKECGGGGALNTPPRTEPDDWWPPDGLVREGDYDMNGDAMGILEGVMLGDQSRRDYAE